MMVPVLMNTAAGEEFYCFSISGRFIRNRNIDYDLYSLYWKYNDRNVQILFVTTIQDYVADWSLYRCHILLLRQGLVWIMLVYDDEIWLWKRSLIKLTITKYSQSVTLLICQISKMWDFQNVRFSKCAIFKMCDFHENRTFWWKSHKKCAIFTKMCDFRENRTFWKSHIL